MTISILAVSSSPFRRAHYREQLRRYGYEVHMADGGVECLEQARRHAPDVVILEVSLPWGGSDGVLALRDQEPPLRRAAVIVIEAGKSPADLYRLGGFSADDFFLFRRLPSSAELARTIEFGFLRRQMARGKDASCASGDAVKSAPRAESLAKREGARGANLQKGSASSQANVLAEVSPDLG